MTNPNVPFFYCPAHQVRFRPANETTILCEQGSHELGNGFPSQSWWTYCCDCATFWPAEFTKGTTPSKECLVCDRVIVRRYLCDTCQVVSIESSAVINRKSDSIGESGIKPNCPACKITRTARSVEHNCPETGFKFLTPRATCAFCQRQIGVAAVSVAAVTKIQCWSCLTDLVAPFKFCKRCGKAQDQPSTALLENTVATTTLPERNVLALPATVADEITCELTSDMEPEPIIAESSHDTGLANNDSTYSPVWQAPTVIPPKRRAKWSLAVIAMCVSAGILLPVFALYGDRKKPSGLPPLTLTAPPGMVYVNGGEFLMGTDDGDEYERPAHKVAVAPFFMDSTEVTCEQYQQFVRATGHRLPPPWTNNSYPPGSAKLPVTGVDWYDADAYAKWVKKRLPTEEEWEFAARSNDGRRYPWGNNWIRGAANAGDSSAQQLVNVGNYPTGKTPSGLMDLAGNAWEWTSSDLDAYPNGKLTEKPSGEIKVVRGGSWQGSTSEITTTYRGYLLASDGGDYSATGFRCVTDHRQTAPSKEN